MTKPCLRTLVTVRRIRKHPLVQTTWRSGSRIRKHIVRGATLGIIPTGIDDVVFHHAPLSIDEAIHIVADQASISVMTGILALAIILVSKD